MRNRSGKGPANIKVVLAVILVAPFAMVQVIAAPSVVSGRLTDPRGAALPGATIVIFPAGAAEGLPACSGPAEAGESAAAAPAAGEVPSGCALLRTDLDGAFAATLPPGRYMVAAVKQGYAVSITEVHSLASRVLRMRLEPTIPDAMRPRRGAGEGIEWLLREDQGDVLRSTGPALPPTFTVAATRDADEAAGPAALLGTIDGDVTQSLTAGDLPGVSSSSVGDLGRATTLAVRAPVDDRLAWNFAAGSARSQSALGDSDEVIAGGADRMIAGADYGGGAAAPALQGGVRAGVGRAIGGSALSSDRLLAAAGSLRPFEEGDPIVVAVHAWSAEAELGGDGFVALDAGAAAARGTSVAVRGASLYAGSVRDLGATSVLHYGLEYRGDSLGGSGRVVPRVGLSHANGGGGLTVNGELLLDPGAPGGRVALECRPGGLLRVAAAVAVMPEFAAAGVDALEPSAPGGVPAPAALAGGRRTLDLSVARDFGPLHGSVTGSLGRTDRRSLPVIEEGPIPLVSTGGEHYYETRLGVAWRPSTTEMQIGYRRVEAAPADGPGDPDYRRMDVVVSQGLPAPRALDGARLRALLAWQSVAYDAVRGGTGAPVTGLASRLSGGVGLSF